MIMSTATKHAEMAEGVSSVFAADFNFSPHVINRTDSREH